VDISKAFDAIDHVLLVEMISNSVLHPNIICWLKAYITRRKAWCFYGPATSSQFILRSGVPQVSVLSPAIFNLYVSDCPTNGDILESYADDFSILESDSNLAALDLRLQKSVDKVVAWAAGKN
jgi:RNA-directed DNA polymerase